MPGESEKIMRTNLSPTAFVYMVGLKIAPIHANLRGTVTDADINNAVYIIAALFLGMALFTLIMFWRSGGGAGNNGKK